MRTRIRNHLVNIILPSVVLSGVTGVMTGVLIFGFRVISEWVIELSDLIFAFAHDHLWAVPLVVLGAVLVALLVSLCLRYSPHARGGGIPTAVALLRGIITFQWLRNIIFVFASALLSYLCGIPLGNDEGPSVQMGTAVGSGVTRIFAKRHLGWERYVMTGGATAGFATATCAPVSAVLFGLEEAHRRFSPLLLISSITSVLSGMFVLRFLCFLTGRDELLSLFHFTLDQVLPLRYLWQVGIVGLACGLFAYVLVKCIVTVRNFSHKKLGKVHIFFKVAPVFAVVVILGCFFHESVGTGHHLINSLVTALFEDRIIWYVCLALLAIRAILVVVTYEVGATGGLFTPLLVFGALIGSLVGELMISIGALEPQYYPVLVVIGMASFFSASVKTPLTAAVFSIEVFSGFTNILPILVGILVSFVVTETIGSTSVNEIAMEREIHKAHRGKPRKMVDVELTALPGSFAIGKEPRDILWPSFCHVLSIREGEEDEKDSYEGGAIKEQDILRLNFTTYDSEVTAAELCAILGEQTVYDRAEVILDTESEQRHGIR